MGFVAGARVGAWGLRLLEPRPPLGFFGRPPQRFALLGELLELEAHPMVSLVFGQELARPWFRDPRERRVDAGHPGIRASPPSEREERDREADQSPGDVRTDHVPEPRPLVNSERIEEERPEH